MKKLLLVPLLLIVLLFLGVALGGGALLRVGVEKGASIATGVDAKVAGASLNVLGGSVSLSGFQLGNPPGFKSAHAFAVGKVGVDASLPSLLSDTFVIEKIEVLSPEVTLEIGPGGGTNLGALLDRLEGKGGGGGGAETPQGGGGKKLRVGEVRIAAAKVRVAQSLVGSLETVVTLGDLTLHDVGSGAEKDQTTLPALLQKILGAIAIAAGQAGGGLPSNLAALLNEETRRATLDSLRGGLEGAGRGLLDDASKELEKATGGASKTLEDLLKKKKDGG